MQGWRSIRVHAALCACAFIWATACLSPTPAPPPPGGIGEAYRVGPPDQLEIVVLPEPVIEKTVLVRPDGRFSFELIGEVDAQGKTVVEIAREIEARIGRYKRNASVSLSVAEAASPTVTVFGQVQRPGVFPLTREVRVAEALGQVGGATIFANKDGIRVIRTDGAETVVIPIDLGAIQGGDLSSNVVLERGDIVMVPPNAFARVGFALQVLLLPLQPLMAYSGLASFAVR